jgi:hypothetical protein
MNTIEKQIRKEVRMLDEYKKMVASWNEEKLREELFRLREKWEDLCPPGPLKNTTIFLSDTYQKLEILKKEILTRGKEEETVDTRARAIASVYKVWKEEYKKPKSKRTKTLQGLSTEAVEKFYPEVIKYSGKTKHGKPVLSTKFKKLRDNIRSSVNQKLRKRRKAPM